MYNCNYTYVNYLFNYIYTILGHLFLQHTGRTLELVIVLIDDQTEIMVNEAPVDPEFSRTARAAWARLIQKVYEVDHMLCPHCGAELRLMTLIMEPISTQSGPANGRPGLARSQSQFRRDDSRDGVDRATHDCMDAGGRVKQESEPRKPKPSGITCYFPVARPLGHLASQDVQNPFLTILWADVSLTEGFAPGMVRIKSSLPSRSCRTLPDYSGLSDGSLSSIFARIDTG
ncbi:MAG: hypothetical protein HW411_1653 [Gammaproteobacteria bacterium]|nr:hypothetical protein [Gammaproteobacteria bacterium]